MSTHVVKAVGQTRTFGQNQTISVKVERIEGGGEEWCDCWDLKVDRGWKGTVTQGKPKPNGGGYYSGKFTPEKEGTPASSGNGGRYTAGGGSPSSGADGNVANALLMLAATNIVKSQGGDYLVIYQKMKAETAF